MANPKTRERNLGGTAKSRPSEHETSPVDLMQGKSPHLALDGFHPAVRQWFDQTFEHPTRVQQRGWEAIRSGAHTLIAAPTGSGKTLTAFLNALDELLREGVERSGELPDETYVLYVSPLKALSADVHKNLAEPRRAIQQVAHEMGLEAPRITAAVRSGDTPANARQAMLRKPPHILVTTPESLYLLLTAKNSREMLRTIRTVIVDEIHAVVESRRGSHLALSLERLQHITGRPLQRIGLSATQKPLDEVARFLVGSAHEAPVDAAPDCRIIDEGHERTLDLALELPGSPLESVLSSDVREEMYDRIAALIEQHKTTLVFVNTRREAERTVHRLSERLGEEAITAHHGSMSKERRLDAERRLKNGDLKALVATASLELGIDIGHVDLVCQIGFPRRISALLQRVGRSGHTVYGTPKGRLFPMTRNELLECVALLRCVRRGDLDRIEMLEAPLDILAQQIVAEAACEDWDEDELFALFRRAHPYRNLDRSTFDEIVQMVSNGFATSRGRRGARVHYDAVNRRLRGRRGSRMLAITSGGAIPDNADYRVVLEPENTFIGTVDEDFAVESMPGDIFQLGSSSWRIQRVETGAVRVEDAHGEPPTIPFWFGEAPSRSTELSKAVSELRRDLECTLDEPYEESSSHSSNQAAAEQWLRDEVGISVTAALQIVHYVAETKRILGVVPTQDTIVLERFFDDAGGMQLILHSPFGSRVNRAWGLALRKRFCRQFNFELQAAATDEGVLLSLGPQHSFPLEEVFRYLHSDTVKDVLVQALLDAPMFQTHWRWNASLSLALLRFSGGRKVAPQIQRMQAEDLLVSVFPDAAACLETIEGEREVPDHPLVRQTIHDCLTEVMDLPRLMTILARIQSGDMNLVAIDTLEASPFSHELLTARPYAFLDDAPLEERRASAVQTRRAMDPSSAGERGMLSEEAIRLVQSEAWPVVETADELHDALLTYGFLLDAEVMKSGWMPYLEEIIADRRVAQIVGARAPVFYVAVERLHEARLVWPAADVRPEVRVPDTVHAPETREDALNAMIRSRLAMMGPATPDKLAADSGLTASIVDQTLAALEAEGSILRGRFTPGTATVEWCDRRLLARIHRYTLDRLRAEIQPVSASDYIRFLLRWQHVEPGHRVRGEQGVAAILEQIEGYELPGAAWETEVLSARCEEYTPDLLDSLCTSGRAVWGRLSVPNGSMNGLRTTGPLKSSPIAIWKREHHDFWMQEVDRDPTEFDAYARQVHDVLQRQGACFFQDIVTSSGLLPTQVEEGLGELVAYGAVTSDSFSGLRALLTPVDRRPSGSPRPRKRGKTAPYGVHTAGRWSLLLKSGHPPQGYADDDLETWARLLLRRYGVIFRRILTRESFAPPWRDLIRVLWRLEARGEIRGGRFVSGFAGEQFALPEAVGALRKMRNATKDGKLIFLSAADPLNLAGIITPGGRIPAVTSNRIGYRDGVPVVALEAGTVRNLENGDDVAHDVRTALRRRNVPPELTVFVK